MLVNRVPVLNEDDAADFLGLSPSTLKTYRSRKTGPRGPVYQKLPNGRIRYRLDQLERWRDGDTRTSTTEPYRPEAVAP